MPKRHFQGDRTIDGAIVTVDGEPLDARLDVKSFTDREFEWGYEGDGPRQLALAILIAHSADTGMAVEQCEEFMCRVVANFGNEWEMSSDDIDTALRNIQTTS